MMNSRLRPASPAIVALVGALTLVVSGCSTLPWSAPPDDGAELGSSIGNGAGASGSTGGGADATGDLGYGYGLTEPIEADFVSGPCAFDVPPDATVDCGTVTVPMNWSTGDGEVVLAVALFASTADDPAPDPVIYLEGGPGGHALEPVQYAWEDMIVPLLERGDVILFDQRGAGLSEPRLVCDEVEAYTRQQEDAATVDDDTMENGFHDALSACHDRLIGQGIDLSQFNTINNAHDVEAIRVALGYDQLNLFGISYGTKLGLEMLRQHPGSVRSAVIDSVYPPDVDSVAENPESFLDSYDKVVAACAAETQCAAGGDLGQRLSALAQDLQANPRRIEVKDWITGETDDIYLSGDGLVGLVTQSLYSPSWFIDLPELVSDLEAGNTDVAETFASQIRTTERFFSDGMFFSFTCGEEVALTDPSTVVDPADPFGLRDTWDLASNTGTAAFETCDAFPVDVAPELSNQPVTSDVPTLLMAGEYDPVTPVAWAMQAASTLSNSQVVVGPFQSHGVSGGPCGISIVVAFIDDPSAPVDSSCLAEAKLFFLAADAQGTTLEDFSYTDGYAGLVVSGRRPADWMVGSLDGDQYRQQSFLDPTQLFQLVGDDDLSAGIESFLEDNADLTIGPAQPLTGTVGRSYPVADLNRTWRKREGRSDGANPVVVEWFESDIDGGRTVFVILVAPEAEVEIDLDTIVGPALAAITVEDG